MQSRHREIEKIEQSVEQLATLFQDMQMLLEIQQEKINVIEAHVDSAYVAMADGSKEMTTAIQHRVIHKLTFRLLVGRNYGGLLG